MSLTQELADLKAHVLENFPKEVTDQFQHSIEQLNASRIVDGAPKAGDQIKDFALPNASGQQRRLEDLRASGPVVIVFYRGGWCPYCNLELRAYQQQLPQLKAAGARLVAITPELPDNSLSTIEKNELEFEVLTDVDSKYAKRLGLAFSLPENLRPIYKELGGDLEKFNGAGQFDLPIPATLVIDTDGKIAFSHVDPDYTTRANPEDVLAVVQDLAQVAASA